MHIFVALALEEVDVGLPYLPRVHALHRSIPGSCESCKITTIRRDLPYGLGIASDVQVGREIISNDRTKRAIPFIQLHSLAEIWTNGG